ncbi:MAG: hypothetical protein U5L45_14855 [Saprospiraceae bacterium]|nr:hypothetical protein [Saprospiraceae bacterium]
MACCNRRVDAFSDSSLIFLALLAKKGNVVRFSGKARKTNHLSSLA